MGPFAAPKFKQKPIARFVAVDVPCGNILETCFIYSLCDRMPRGAATGRLASSNPVSGPTCMCCQYQSIKVQMFGNVRMRQMVFSLWPLDDVVEVEQNSM